MLSTKIVVALIVVLQWSGPDRCPVVEFVICVVACHLLSFAAGLIMSGCSSSWSGMVVAPELLVSLSLLLQMF